MVGDIFDVRAVRDDTTLSPGLHVGLASQVGEAPLVGDKDLLTTRQLVLGTSEGLNDDSTVGVLDTDAHQDLTNLDTGNRTIRLTVGTTHTGLQTIGTGATQHLVDAEDVEGMDTDTQVEAVLATALGDVLVAANTGGFQGLRADLLTLIRQQVNAQRELIDAGLLATEVKDLDLWLRDTAAEAALGIWLSLAVTIAACRTTTHLDRGEKEMEDE